MFKRARLAKGLTQAQMAKRLGVSAGYYGKIERGDVKCPASLKSKAKRALSGVAKKRKAVKRKARKPATLSRKKTETEYKRALERCSKDVAKATKKYLKTHPKTQKGKFVSRTVKSVGSKTRSLLKGKK